MKKRFFFPLLVAFFLPSTVALAANTTTVMSQKASRIKPGMSKDEVLERLGPARWVSIPGDIGPYAVIDPWGDQPVSFELMWRNPGCKPVSIGFDQDGEVAEIDTGLSTCFEGIEQEYPSERYSCAKSDRAGLCR